jgi:hypothetical protein
LKLALIFIAFFLLLFINSAGAAIYYVDMNGSDSNSGNSSKPFQTVRMALESAKYGDTVSINDGTYSEGQLKVPEGVNLTSSSKDNTKVKLQPNRDLSTSAPFILLSSSPGSNGNQSISYLEFDGINDPYRAYSGIAIKSRNNVRIHHCNIHDFYGGWTATAVSAESTQISPTKEWWIFWPADPQRVGVDTNIDALWPANPVTGFELAYNTITEGGYRQPLPGLNTTGAVQLWNLKDSDIHHNTITTTGVSKGQCITGKGGKTALLDNVDIYYNTFDHYVHDDKTNFSLETWVHKGGCDIYSNYSIGWFSVTVGKETRIFDNYLTISPPETTNGIAIEFNAQSYGEIYGNSIENPKYGIIVGFSHTQGKDWMTRDLVVRDNVIINSKKSSVWVMCLGSLGEGDNPTASDFDVYNNKIYSEDSIRGEHGIIVSETIHEYIEPSPCTLENVHVYENQVSGMNTAAGKTVGLVSNLIIDNNNFYGNNRNNRWLGSNATNTDTTDMGPIVLLPPPVMDVEEEQLTPPILNIVNQVYMRELTKRVP